MSDIKKDFIVNRVEEDELITVTADNVADYAFFDALLKNAFDEADERIKTEKQKQEEKNAKTFESAKKSVEEFNKTLQDIIESHKVIFDDVMFSDLTDEKRKELALAIVEFEQNTSKVINNFQIINCSLIKDALHRGFNILYACICDDQDGKILKVIDVVKEVSINDIPKEAQDAISELSKEYTASLIESAKESVDKMAKELNIDLNQKNSKAVKEIKRSKPVFKNISEINKDEFMATRKGVFEHPKISILPEQDKERLILAIDWHLNNKDYTILTDNVYEFNNEENIDFIVDNLNDNEKLVRFIKLDQSLQSIKNTLSKADIFKESQKALEYLAKESNINIVEEVKVESLFTGKRGGITISKNGSKNKETKVPNDSIELYETLDNLLNNKNGEDKEYAKFERFMGIFLKKMGEQLLNIK